MKWRWYPVRMTVEDRALWYRADQPFLSFKDCEAWCRAHQDVPWRVYCAMQLNLDELKLDIKPDPEATA